MTVKGDSPLITYDANGVPRVRDTGIAVWKVITRLGREPSHDAVLAAYPALHADDLTAVAHYRIEELSHFLRKLAHDGISQMNSIAGFTELARRGMIDGDEARDLLADPLRNSTQAILNFLTHTGRVLNGTTDLVADSQSFSFPMRVRGFLHELIENAKGGAPAGIRFEGENAAPENATVVSDEGLQTALIELIRLRYFARRFEDECLIRLDASDAALRLFCERAAKGTDSPNFLFDWSLSPVPVAAYMLEERGGSLACAVSGNTVRFTVTLPIELRTAGGA